MNWRRIVVWSLLVAALLVVETKAASAQQHSTTAPPTGRGGIIAGSILSGLGVLNLAYTPVCFLDGGDFGLGAEVCMGVQLGAGGLFVAVGVPVLIAGGVRRSRYKEWLQNNQLALVPVISPDYNGAALSLVF